MIQQDFKLSLRMVQKKLDQYSKLPLEKKECNLFLLKTSVSDIILLLNYFLLKKGNMLGLEVKSSDSLKKKREIFNYYEEGFFNDKEKRFLINMEKFRNKIAHSDTIFPTFEETELILNNFIDFQESISLKLNKHKETSVQLQNICNEILSYSYHLEKFLPDDQKEREFIDGLKEHATMYRKLSRSTHNDISRLRDDVYSVYKKLKDLYGINKQFLIFLSNQEWKLLNHPKNLMKTYFLENDVCPNCSTDEDTQKFSICKWIINTQTYNIESFNPLKIEKKKHYLFISWYACDLCCFEEICFKCQESGWEAQKSVPKDSYYCENCGFFYLFEGEIGISSNF